MKKAEANKDSEDKSGASPKAAGLNVEDYAVRDVHALTVNLARMTEEMGKAASAWLAPREKGEKDDFDDGSMAEIVKTLSQVGEYWMADPQRMFQAQTHLMSSYMDNWQKSLRKMTGETVEDPLEALQDKRFADSEWSNHPFFNFWKRTFLVTAQWAQRLVDEAEGLDEHTKRKADFYVKQMTNAVAPSNFILTNPELFRETLAENGQNLVRGMRQLAEDLSAGKGELKLRQSSESRFIVGENIAATPGKVVAQNDLCQIIQYEATTKKVFKRPLLIVPPWINKYYILDLNPEKSFVKWAVDRGHTVFMVSWVNPVERHAKKDWDCYLQEGIVFGLDTIEAICGKRAVNAVGYCVGGTLLAAGLAVLQARGDERIAAATLLTTQVDFTHAGDLKVFVDEEQIAGIERKMSKKGYLEGSHMATAFNLLRSSDLIWPYVVSNYMKGKEPVPFDLLYWNSDSTRMTAANHSYYLRNLYLENRLTGGTMKLDGRSVNLGDVTIPIYNLATREDHIAPALSVFTGSGYFGGKITFVVSGSGHIAGVVNPPAKKKYQFWTDGETGSGFDAWMETAKETPGSWWPHWQKWIASQEPGKIAARKVGGKSHKPVEDAPGSYVRVRS